MFTQMFRGVCAGTQSSYDRIVMVVQVVSYGVSCCGR